MTHHRNVIAGMALATLLCIGGTASAQVVIKGNVFGGGNLGEVTENTVVNVNDGTIGKKLTLEERMNDDNAQIMRVHQGSVYGGGNGYSDFDPNSGAVPNFDKNAGRVKGNTCVTIGVSGNADYKPVVRRAVYGGGNIATVGTCSFANDEAYVPTYTAETGLATVTIQGNALIGPTKDDLTKDDAGNALTAAEIDTCFKYLGCNEGWVFGGSRGFAGSELKQFSFADSTIVLVTDDAQVLTVFGGGENGHVKKGTNVTISGDAIIGGVPLHGPKVTNPSITSTSYTISGGEYNNVTVHLKAAEGELIEDEFGVGRTIYRGNVYGGGKGTDFVSWLSPNQYSYSAGRVYGNTTLTIEGNAQIYDRVYGGAPLASVGTFTYEDPTNEHAITGILSGGHTFVNINGGTIGTNGLNNGDVFGGGRGLPGRAKKSSETLKPLHQFMDLAYVGYTHVTVDGAKVKNSVYGGAANGHVQGNANVLIKETTSTTTEIGISGQGGWHSNVYAGGGGTARYKEPGKDPHHSIVSGRVFGDVTLTIEGGTIYHNVYGGGAIASVGTYNHTSTTQPYLGHGHSYVTITGGTIGTNGDQNGMVFGSGRGEIAAPGAFMDSLTYVAYSTVNIGKQTGGTFNDLKINGSVYGSGENGHTYLKSEVNVYSGTIGCTLSEYGEMTAEQKANLFPYRGNVYGAGCGTDEYARVPLYYPGTTTQALDPATNQPITVGKYNPLAGITQGNTEVNIYGGYISRSVYGGGAMGSVGVFTQIACHDDVEQSFALSWPYKYEYVSIKDENGNDVTTGKTEVTVTGGHIGTYADLNALAYSGDVYGGARGMAGNRYDFVPFANVKESVVNINYSSPANAPSADGNFIVNSVFGGGENGHVYKDTEVTIDKGFIGGTVFGAGKGKDTYWDFLKSYDTSTGEETTNLAQVHSITAGKVFGNTVVTLNDGVVQHNVFGGGEYASVGIGNYFGYGELTEDQESIALTQTTGKSTVNINGGTIGSNGYLDEYSIYNGYVYGSSKGTVYPTVTQKPDSHRYDYSRDFFLGYTNHTVVNIGSTTGEGAGPQVKGSVFGGGENGHVRWHTNVTINKGEIGAAYVDPGIYPEADSLHKWVYRGNVYGAGRGIDKIDGTNSYCNSAGSVTLNTQVTVNGGTIHRNVYGGGSNASVGPPPTGYNPGTSLDTVAINGGTIGEMFEDGSLYGGDIYGGSRGARDLLATGNIGRFANVNNTAVSVNPGATVLGNVYGGGELGQVTQNTKVYLTGGTDKGSVFGGGKGDTSDEKAALVLGNATVDMTGGTVERSIYGGGQIGSVGTFVEATAIQMDYHEDPEDPTSAVIATVKVPTECESGTGLATVKVSGGFVGKNGSLMPWTDHNPDDDDRGWIFCGGQGVADSISYYKAPALGLVGWTYLEIKNPTSGNPPVITASVYGGCENGLVLDSTYVKIQGGQIGTGYTGNGTTHTWDARYDEAKWTAAITAINNGTIETALGTGGSLHGYFHECDAWTYTSPYKVYDIFANETTHPNNNATHYDYQAAALVGTDGHSFFGNVFGGGSGYYPIEPGVWRRTAGQVNGNTRVEIEGGHILTNVYGGNEFTDVIGKCTVEMSGGTVGIPRTKQQIQARPTNSFVFGAGMGDYRSIFDAYTNVNEAKVNITGGTVFGSVFGGSAEGHVVSHSSVTIGEAQGKSTLIGTTGFSGHDGLVFGGGRGNAKKLNRIDPDSHLKIANFACGRVGGNATVTMSKGTVLGNLYGGGSVARTGVGVNGSFNDFLNDDTYLSDDHGMAKVELTGGTIGNHANNGQDLLKSDQKVGNVYGGGRGDLNEFIEDDLGRSANSAVSIPSGNPVIYGSVFGGGQMANAGHWIGYGPGYAIGTSSTNVTISGSPVIGTALEFDHEHYSTDFKTEYDTINGVRMISHTRTGNVYGGGQGNVRLKQNAQGQTLGTGYPEGLEHGHCGKTDVNISGSPTIMSSVFGGSEQGAVWGDTKVIIGGGTIGTTGILSDSLELVDDEWTILDNHATYSFGSVYGGSYGMDGKLHLNLPLPSPGSAPSQAFDSVNNLAGHVYGDAYVTITGGYVRGNVYGGGDLGQVDGKCDVKISKTSSGTGPVIGPFDETGLNANVFGGGKGFTNDPLEVRKAYVNVGNTEVTVEGGTVEGSVFGGSAFGHVLDDAKVNVHQGATVGHIGNTGFDGNIYGGGMGNGFYTIDYSGDEPDTTNYQIYPTSGRVGGNTYVTMDGGYIKGTIYGGGTLALTGVDVNGDFIDKDHGNTNITVGTAEGSTTRIGTRETDDLLNTFYSVGDIFGSGRGDIENYFDILAGRVTNSTITIYGEPEIGGSVFGGGEMASLGWWTVVSTEYGNKTRYIANTGEATITIGRTDEHGDPIPDDYPIIGTEEEFAATNNTQSPWTIFDPVNHSLLHTCTGNVFGGGQGEVDLDRPQWVSFARSRKATVEINGGDIKSTVYGGSEQGSVAEDVSVTVNDGDITIGSRVTTGTGATNPFYFGGVFGGGYGSDDLAEATDDASNDSTSYRTLQGLEWTPALLAGRVYGDVFVNIYGGTINGNVFGGSERAYIGYELGNTKGNVTTYIGKLGQMGYPDEGTTIKGRVFGANNRSGSPFGNVKTHIISTKHEGDPDDPDPFTELGNCYPTIPTGLTDEETFAWMRTLPSGDANFAIKAVYGGSNLADYTPLQGKEAWVKVYGCQENTIKDIFGGSNAAAIGGTSYQTDANLIIEGGRFDRVFGGGNGEDEPADIHGKANTTIDGGLINVVFGGSNNEGDVDEINLAINQDSGCPEFILDVFGGGNSALIIGDVTSTVECCNAVYNNYYGGSRYATIYGNVNTNIFGATFNNLFGGSMGTEDEPSNIKRFPRNEAELLTYPADHQDALRAYLATHDRWGTGGNVTLNIFGGNITNAFGGSDVRGEIDGEIQVNVFNVEGNCNLNLTNLYGAGYNTAYAPNYIIDEGEARLTPEINVIHGTVKGCVYGGGYGATATTTANPVVNIGYTTAMGSADEDESLVKMLTDTVIAHHHSVPTAYTALVQHDVYGGGDAAPVVGSTSVNVNKANTVIDGFLYGGGNGATAIVNVNSSGDYGNTNVVINDGWIKSNVFGGGNAGAVKHDVNLTMNGGKVGSGTDYGYLFGGANRADIDGQVTVNLHGGTVLWDVFGGNDVSGNIKGQITVNVLETANTLSIGNVFGAGRNATYTPDEVGGKKINSPEVNFINGSAFSVYGGGSGFSATTTAHPVVNIGYNATTMSELLPTGFNAATALASVSSVYGGGDGGDIVGNPTVNVTKDNTSILVSVFGGGGGTPDYPAAAMVHGSDTVRISGGTIGRHVFGGGSFASVTGDTWIEMSDGQVWRSVYGGGAGESSNVILGRVEGKTSVSISDDAFVRGNVYGGGQVGQVYQNATVNVSGGEVGAIEYTWKDDTPHDQPYDSITHVAFSYNSNSDPVYGGSVFGGGEGYSSNAEFGRVKGNTNVTISGGHVQYSVYGGGEMASVGQHTEVHQNPNNPTSEVIDIAPVANTGKATVTISGGQVGPAPRTDEGYNIPIGLNGVDGYVFGGGKGDGNTLSHDYDYFANVNETEVTIEMPMDDGTHVNRLWGSIFGGGEDGHVLGDAHTHFNSGLMGTLGTTSYDGNIFGGGRNYNKKNYTAGRVRGNIHVEMNDGIMYGSIFGGGRLGITGINVDGSTILDGDDYGNVLVEVKGGTVGNLDKMRESEYSIGDVFGGGKGHKVGLPSPYPAASALLISLVKNTDVRISQAQSDVPTRIYGCVYGGGEVANVGKYGWTQVATAPYISNIRLLSDGDAKVTVSGGTVGMDNMQMITESGYPDDFGHVFGGGEGWTESPSTSSVIDTEGNHLVELMATVGNTEVTIEDDAFVLGSVYGGSMNGHVLNDTWVKIDGGQIGAGDGIVDSEGHNRPYTPAEWNSASLKECAHWDYVDGGDPYDPNIKEGDKPKPGKNGATFYGNVFGGGSGYYPYGVDEDGNSQWLRSAGQVRGNTRVEVTGGHILTSLYGGCETSDVGMYTYNNTIHGEVHVSGGQATVIMSGGTLGVPRTLAEIQGHPVTCYVFGSGKGDPRFYFNTWTNVWNAKVEIKGDAWVYGSVFGGGEEGHVLNDVDLDVSGNAKIGTLGYSYVDGNIFGGGRGFTGKALTAGTVGRKIDIDIASGTILGSVYGGGRLGSVGTYLVDKMIPNPENTSQSILNPYYGQFQPGNDHGKITINITGGTIGNDHETATLTHTNSDTYGGNVFGGCMGKVLQRETGSTETPIWPSLARCKETIVTISQASNDVPTIIKNSVYGGGEIGTVRDNTTVNIEGGTIGNTYNGLNCGNVFGGGKGSADITYDNDSTDYLHVNMPTVYLSGRVYGNATVNISGGQIYENVFGGGKLASVGFVEGNVLKNGVATVHMTGGQVGPLDMSGLNAYIFGGPKGVNVDLPGTYKEYCNVNTTIVTVENGTNTNGVVISSPHVKGSLFGGGSDGHVLGDATVNFNGGNLGTWGTTTWDGNIFGGGRNFKATNKTAGRVAGNIHVNMTGGTMLGNIYGGGRLASTGIDVNGDTIAGTNHGYVYVNVTGGTIGYEHLASNCLNSSNQPVVPWAGQYGGDIFGGAMGADLDPHMTWTGAIPASETDANFAAYTDYIRTQIGWVKNTEVTLNGSSSNQVLVRGCVFGGSKNGCVSKNAKVTIEGNSIVGVDRGDPDHPKPAADLAKLFYSGNVYGGGLGSERSVAENVKWPDVGRVYGNTEVYISNNQGGTPKILNNIYGGGALAGLGTLDNSGNYINGINGGPSGNTYVEMSGGELGPLDMSGTNAYVFGGGQGQPPYAFKDFGKVNNTHLVVKKNAEPAYGAARVYGSLFGGGEDGHVVGNAVIDVEGGNLGTTGQTTWDGNIFGGGRNYQAAHRSTGRVGGNVNINVKEVTMRGSVFGGGRLGSVGVNDLDGNAFGMQEGNDHGFITVNIGGTMYGTNGLPLQVGSNVITQTGPIIIGHTATGEQDRVGGNVFGGGKGTAGAPGTIYPDLAMVKQTTVNIGETNAMETWIEGSVFGSGEDGHVLQDTYVNVYDGQIGGSTYNLANPTNCADSYHGNVYGGGRGLNMYDSDGDGVLDAYSESAGVVYGNTNVYIEGGRICRMVYGGGNLASVGTYPETPDASGNYHTGLAKITITGDAKIGVEPNSNNRNGNVFGAGKGKAGVSYQNLSLVRNTEVTITGNSQVYGTVYGSGEDGHVFHRANILIGDATIGSTTVDGSNVVIGTNGAMDVDGNVYGAGRGIDLDNGGHYSSTAGIVGISTNIEINNGLVKGSVFGGGRLASVGHNHALEDANGDIDIATIPDDFGKATVSITGDAIIGTNGTLDNGHVFGSGMGELGYADLTYVFETDVNVNGNAKVYGSVYGSGEVGHVRAHTITDGSNTYTKEGNANVTIGTPINNVASTCTIGVTSNTDEKKGNVFGGGHGNLASATAGMVDGIARTTINGGTITKKVFGGGDIGLVDEARIVNINDGTVIGDVLGGNNTIPTVEGVVNNSIKTVNVRGGNIEGSVYGCSYNALEGKVGEDEKWTSFVNISGGTIGYSTTGVVPSGNVYAAGYGGEVKGSVTLNVGLNAIKNAPTNNPSESSSANIYYQDGLNGRDPDPAKIKIQGNLFDGSYKYQTEPGISWVYSYDISGYSTMFIDGDGYNTADNNEASTTPYMNIGGGIYGGGNFCESGLLGRKLLIKDYGTRITNSSGEVTGASRELTTLQRGGIALIDNSNIQFTGAPDLSQRYEDRDFFAVLEVDDGLYVANASSFILGTDIKSAYMDSIKEIRSLHLKPGTGTSYTNIDDIDNGNWEWIGVKNMTGEPNTSDFARLFYITNSTTPLTSAQENVIIFNGDSRLWVRYHDKVEDKIKYGALTGFFRMRADHFSTVGVESFAYARPKLTDYVNPIAGHSAPENTGDGGFLSYVSMYNDFTKPQTVLQFTYTSNGDDGGDDFTETKQYPYYNYSLVTAKGDLHEHRAWVLPVIEGHIWYVDGRGIGTETKGWGKDESHTDGWGDYPDKPKLTITANDSEHHIYGIFHDPSTQSIINPHRFDPEKDIIFVVGPIQASREQANLNQNTTYQLKLFRYPGGHKMSNGQTDATTTANPNTTTVPTNSSYSGLGPGETLGPGANLGAMVLANKPNTSNFVMENVLVDGLYAPTNEEETVYTIPDSYVETEQRNVSKPLVVTTSGSQLTLKGNYSENDDHTVRTYGTVLTRGYNNTDAALWFTHPDYKPYTASWEVTDYHGGALFVDTTATVNVSGLLTINDNKQNKSGSLIDCNVYLPTFSTKLFMTDELKNEADRHTRIGVTSPKRNRASKYQDNTLSPVAEANKVDAEATSQQLAEMNASIARDAWTNDNFIDDQQWFFGNGNHTTYYDSFNGGDYGSRVLSFGWTWANVVREMPTGFAVNDINSAEDLAWLISMNTGMNGVTRPTDFSGQDLVQTDDIDLGQYVWVPIGEIFVSGSTSFDHNPFDGNYDGQGHLIYGLYVDSIGMGDTRYRRQNYGLFGHVTGNVNRTFVVSGMVFPEISVDISNTDAFNIGGLVGSLKGGTVANSEAALTVKCPNKAGLGIVAGGLVAKLESGEIHSSMAMPWIYTRDLSTGPVGGLVGSATEGYIYNSFVNGRYTLNAHHKSGGLLGSNVGATMLNCYVNWNSNSSFGSTDFKSIVNENGGSVDYCYAKTAPGIDLGDTEDNGAGSHSKNFTTTDSADKYGYMYLDNTVPKQTGTQTVDTAMFRMLNHWVDSTNKVNHNHTYARWSRPGLSEINGDYPVLLLNDMMDGVTEHQGDFRSLGTIPGIPGVLQYGGTVRDGKELDGALGRLKTDNALFIYGDITETPEASLSSETKMSIQEDVAILNTGVLKNYNSTYVGITFDNSFGEATASPGINVGLYGADFLGLPRDWHMFSTPLTNAPLGFDYYVNGINTNVKDHNTIGSETTYYYNNPWVNPETDFSWLTNTTANPECASTANRRYWMKSYDEADGYFPTTRGYALTGNVSDWFIENSDECPSSGTNFQHRYPYGMDFYTWNEPQYHWINFKRNGPNHWHSDIPHVHLDYMPAEMPGYSLNQNEDNLIVGRGYMASIGTETFMQSHGTLTNTEDETSIMLTNNGWKLEGWNLVGNPFHSYLDFNELAKEDASNVLDVSNVVNPENNDIEGKFYVVYNADKFNPGGDATTAFKYYPVNGSTNGDYAERFLHPHQGFFVKTKKENGGELKFKESMLVSRADVKGGSHFRNDDRPAYPLVNLYLSSDKGCADVTVIEFERPEWGGARKLKELRVGDGLFYGHHEGTYYAALFAQAGVERVPLWFEAKDDDIFTIKWNTANGDFQSMYLIDNIAGVQYDMLMNNAYTFEGHKGDYPSRFYIVFNVTGVEEYEEEHPHFAFFDGSEWVVTGDGVLQFIDVHGRILAEERVSGQSRIALPQVADGPYLFRLTNSHETKVQKVIVRH